MKKIFGYLASISEKRPWLVVLAVTLITLFLAAGFPRITTELSQEAMMPEDYESVQALEEVGDRFGGISYENVLLVADDITSPEITEKLLELSSEMMAEEGFEEGEILNVETYLDFLKTMPENLGLEISFEDIPIDDAMLAQILDFYVDPDPSSTILGDFEALLGYEMPEEMREQTMAIFMDNSERVVGGSINEDRTAALISFQVSPDLSENEQVELAEKLDDFVADEFGDIEGLETYIAGNASMQKDSKEFMQRETNKLMLIAFLFVMLILYLTFRRFSDIALPLLIIFVAIAWILGVMGWAGIAYTTMSIAVMPLMLGINIAYVIHVLSRYYEEREDGESVNLSATTSVKTVGVAVFLTAVTTMIGFSSFMITDMPPMRDFGLLCVLGIAFSFLLSLTLLPAIVVIRDRRKRKEKLEAHLDKMRARRRDAWYGRITDSALVRMALVSERHHWTVTVITLLLVGFAVFAIFNVKTGADVTKMFPEGMPSREASLLVTDYFGPQSSDVVLVKGDVYEPENLELLLGMKDAIANDVRNQPDSEDYFSRDRIVSLADLVKKANGGELPDSRQGVEETVALLGQQMDVNQLVKNDEGATYAMISLTSGYPDVEDEYRLKADIIRDHAAAVEEQSQMDLSSTGMTFLVADLLGNILPTQLKTSGLALLLCAFVLIVVFRSLAYGLAALVVVMCGVFVEIILLFALGWPLDIMTVMVSSLVIGAGIDFGIHITHRFREEWSHGETPLDESIKNTVLHVGRALLAAALTTCGVFAILGASGMTMMQRFGITTAVALLGALFGAVLVLPSLLAIIASRETKRREARATSPAAGGPTGTEMETPPALRPTTLPEADPPGEE
ncbi:MAG: efflux RND transporter permease subunit [Actinomycetota bacterium]|nr:efflux RND transporter permease subunit [Actinomycetota bacterium]